VEREGAGAGDGEIAPAQREAVEIDRAAGVAPGSGGATKRRGGPFAPYRDTEGDLVERAVKRRRRRRQGQLAEVERDAERPFAVRLRRRRRQVQPDIGFAYGHANSGIGGDVAEAEPYRR